MRRPAGRGPGPGGAGRHVPGAARPGACLRLVRPRARAAPGRRGAGRPGQAARQDRHPAGADRAVRPGAAGVANVRGPKQAARRPAGAGQGAGRGGQGAGRGGPPGGRGTQLPRRPVLGAAGRRPPAGGRAAAAACRPAGPARRPGGRQAAARGGERPGRPGHAGRLISPDRDTAAMRLSPAPA
ncbi:hypothetical protein SBRY_80295 [Actinacidiphila bryophytorum]|uniref:Uncharacterized protein n=1 Tax=Actinacidiphila bryophytorum TaxID=1436133 RepID=A0A9W4ML72_9ACTN|nr:hypothetical protein SBRY_80295 [Actinacidiphila bryophytorum]